MTDTLDYTIAALTRAAENGYAWSLTSNEAGALVAEVERLRERLEVRTQHGHNLRTMLESATETERAAVVAWLREKAGAWGTEGSMSYAADLIEDGEHRREEEP